MLNNANQHQKISYLISMIDSRYSERMPLAKSYDKSCYSKIHSSQSAIRFLILNVPIKKQNWCTIDEKNLKRFCIRRQYLIDNRNEKYVYKSSIPKIVILFDLSFKIF